MQLSKIFTAAALCGALVSLPAAAAPEQSQFSALQGIEAQALSATEMDAVHGALTVSQIRGALATALSRSGVAQTVQDLVLNRFDRFIAPKLLQFFKP